MAKWFRDTQDIRDERYKKNRDIERKSKRVEKNASLMSALDVLAGNNDTYYENDNEGTGGGY